MVVTFLSPTPNGLENKSESGSVGSFIKPPVLTITISCKQVCESKVYNLFGTDGYFIKHNIIIMYFLKRNMCLFCFCWYLFDIYLLTLNTILANSNLL